MAHINWKSGDIHLASHTEATPSWSIAIAGDWAPVDDIAEQLLSSPHRFYGDIFQVLSEADLAILNLEGVVSERGIPTRKDGPHIQIPVSIIKALTVVPFHLACLANNHSMDYGPVGLEDMLKRLSQNSISFVGAGMNAQEANQPFITEICGTRLAVICAAEGEDANIADDSPGVSGLVVDRLIEEITYLRDKVDIIVVILHAGREFLPLPPPYLYRACHAFVDAGADVVVGHHPHVPQGVEIYSQRPIAYSLGNFVMPESPDVSRFRHIGYIFKLQFTGKMLVSSKIIPYRTNQQSIELLRGEELTRFLFDLERVSSPLQNPAEVEIFWDTFCDQWVKNGLNRELVSIVSLLLNVEDLLTAWLNQIDHRSDLLSKIIRRSLRFLGALSSFNYSRGSRMRRGAAILRNRFITQAHRELYLNGLERSLSEKTQLHPKWALDLIDEWDSFSL